MSQTQILLIKPRWLDATKTEAEIARIRTQFPNARITLMADAPLASQEGNAVFLSLPGLGSTPKPLLVKTILQLRSARFDEAIVLTEQPLKEVGYLESKLWALLARASRRTLGGIRPIRASEEIADKWQRGVLFRVKVNRVRATIRKMREQERRQREAIRAELKRGAVPRTVCPVCQQPLVALTSGEGAPDYARCPECHSLYFAYQPDSNKLANFYDKGYFSGSKIPGTLDLVTREAHKRLETFVYLHAFERQWGTEKGSFLDIGCAVGYALDIARDHGWTTTGIDISAWATQRAAERGHTVVTSDLLAADFDRKFRLITLIDTLSHVSDPAAALRKLASLLDEEGVGIVRTLDPRERGQTAPLPTDVTAICFPGEDAIRRICAEVGLEVVEAKESVFEAGTLEFWLRQPKVRPA